MSSLLIYLDLYYILTYTEKLPYEKEELMILENKNNYTLKVKKISGVVGSIPKQVNVSYKIQDGELALTTLSDIVPFSWWDKLIRLGHS